MRLSATGLVMDALVPAVLEQRVTGMEARRAWRGLLRRYGTPAPGPVPDLRVPPSAAARCCRSRPGNGTAWASTGSG